MSFNFFVKSNITFGRGAVEKLPEIIAGYGLKNIMVVYDRGVKAAGIAERVMEQVKKAGVKAVLMESFQTRPMKW